MPTVLILRHNNVILFIIFHHQRGLQRLGQSRNGLSDQIFYPGNISVSGCCIILLRSSQTAADTPNNILIERKIN